MKKYMVAMQSRAGSDQWRREVLMATSPAVAVKRLMDGAFDAGYVFATRGPNGLKLAVGEQVTIAVKRLA